MLVLCIFQKSKTVSLTEDEKAVLTDYHKIILPFPHPCHYRKGCSAWMTWETIHMHNVYILFCMYLLWKLGRSCFSGCPLSFYWRLGVVYPLVCMHKLTGQIWISLEVIKIRNWKQRNDPTICYFCRTHTVHMYRRDWGRGEKKRF